MQTLEELTSRWEKTRLLEGISDYDRKVAVVSCLETQRVHNEQGESTELWARISIPVTLRVFSATKNLFVGENFENLAEHKSNFHVLKTKYEFVEEGRSSQGIAKQAEEISKFCSSVALELDEIFRDVPRHSRINFNGFMPTKVGFIVYV